MFEKIKASDGNPYTPDAVFTDSEGNRVGVIGQATTPPLSAGEMQYSVEAVLREIAIPAHNSLVDALNNSGAAADMGAEDFEKKASTVQAEIAKRIISSGIKFLRLNTHKEFETSVDGKTWEAVAPAGHTVIDGNGAAMTQRRKIKFDGATVEDDGTQTVVKGLKGDKPVKGVDYFTQEDIDEVAEEAAGMVKFPIATATTAGVVKPSNDFDVSADGTLSLYTPLSLFTSATIDNDEIGSVADRVYIRWATNKTPIYVIVNGQQVDPTSKGIWLTGLSVSSDTEFPVTAADSRGSVTSNAVVRFHRYIYSKTGAPDAAPTKAAECVKQSDVAIFGSSGATFNYSAGDTIWLLTTKQGAKIQTNVLGQWADVNTYGGDPVQFTQANGVTATYYAYRTDVFTAAGSAKYRIL